jgi:hypothetical protein
VWGVMRQGDRRVGPDDDIEEMEEPRRKASFILADTWWKAVKRSSTACDLCFCSASSP